MVYKPFPTLLACCPATARSNRNPFFSCKEKKGFEICLAVFENTFQKSLWCVCWYVYYSDTRLLTPIGLTQRAHRWRPTPGPPPVIPGPESRPSQAALSRPYCSGLGQARHCFRSLGPHRGRVGRDECPSPGVSPL